MTMFSNLCRCHQKYILVYTMHMDHLTKVMTFQSTTLLMWYLGCIDGGIPLPPPHPQVSLVIVRTKLPEGLT